MNNSIILHLAGSDDLAKAHASGHYRCASLDTEGFVHCCDAGQLAGVVQRYYADIDDVLLLEIEVASLDAPLIRENTVGGEELFPHVYGQIPVAAIRREQPFGRGSQARIDIGLAPPAS